MAVEPRRGCGYRKIGGLYFVGGGRAYYCDRLPIPLETCPTCGHGIKQTRGFTWVQTAALVGGLHPNCQDDFPCPLCMKPDELGRSGLLWIGERFYKTPHDFDREAAALGVSRRIHAIPRGFKVGETWILFAHPKAVDKWEPLTEADRAAAIRLNMLLADDQMKLVLHPGIFKVWRPERIEILLPESRRGTVDDSYARERGYTPVFVPDDDPDHRGTVYEDEENGGDS